MITCKILSSYSTGIYNKIHPSEGDAVFTLKSKKVFKKERIFKLERKHQHPEIIRKDIVLMNKIFNRVYGNTYKKFSESNFMKVYPDIDHFNSYYGDEADTFEISQGWFLSMLFVLFP